MKEATRIWNWWRLKLASAENFSLWMRAESYRRRCNKRGLRAIKVHCPDDDDSAARRGTGRCRDATRVRLHRPSGATRLLIDKYNVERYRICIIFGCIIFTARLHPYNVTVKSIFIHCWRIQEKDFYCLKSALYSQVGQARRWISIIRLNLTGNVKSSYRVEKLLFIHMMWELGSHVKCLSQQEHSLASITRLEPLLGPIHR